jgi:hypothetical protein
MRKFHARFILSRAHQTSTNAVRPIIDHEMTVNVLFSAQEPLNVRFAADYHDGKVKFAC